MSLLSDIHFCFICVHCILYIHVYLNGQNKRRPIRFNSIVSWTTTTSDYVQGTPSLYMEKRRASLALVWEKRRLSKSIFRFQRESEVVRYNRVFIGWRRVPFLSFSLFNLIESSLFHTLAQCFSMESNRICDQKNLGFLKTGVTRTCTPYVFMRSTFFNWPAKHSADKSSCLKCNKRNRWRRSVSTSSRWTSFNKEDLRNEAIFSFLCTWIHIVHDTMRGFFCCTWCDHTEICLDSKEAEEQRDKHSHYVAWLHLYWPSFIYFIHFCSRLWLLFLFFTIIHWFIELLNERIIILSQLEKCFFAFEKTTMHKKNLYIYDKLFFNLAYQHLFWNNSVQKSNPSNDEW